jgi:hypothetical protein
MGTRSLTRVIPRQKGLNYADGHKYPEKAVVNMYRQYDGYPDGHGIDLAEFLKDIKIVNGIQYPSNELIANGSGCLAAQMVKHFKDEVGYIYLNQCSGSNGDCWEDYIYTLYPKKDEPTYIAIYKVYEQKCIFIGTPKQLLKKYKTNTNKKG